MVIEFLLGVGASVTAGFLTEILLKKDLEKRLKKKAEEWIQSIPEKLISSSYPFLTVFFDSSYDQVFGLTETQLTVRKKLVTGTVPEIDEIYKVLLVRKKQVYMKFPNSCAQFFKEKEDTIKEYLYVLSSLFRSEIILTERIFKLDTYEKIELIPSIYTDVTDIKELLNKIKGDNKKEKIYFQPNDEINFNVVHCFDWQKDGWFRVRISFYLSSNINSNIICFNNKYFMYRSENYHPVKKYGIIINGKEHVINSSGYLDSPLYLERDKLYKIELVTEIFTLKKNGKIPFTNERSTSICTTYGRGILSFTTKESSYKIAYYLNVGRITLNISQWIGEDYDA